MPFPLRHQNDWNSSSKPSVIKVKKWSNCSTIAFSMTLNSKYVTKIRKGRDWNIQQVWHNIDCEQFLILLLRPGRMRAREMRACSRDEWLVILTFHLPCVALRGRKDDCLQSRYNTGFPGTHVRLQYYESFS